jgi:hypothetical protein
MKASLDTGRSTVFQTWQSVSNQTRTMLLDTLSSTDHEHVKTTLEGLWFVLGLAPNMLRSNLLRAVIQFV